MSSVLFHKVADTILQRIQRSPLYYRHYNNTLDFRVNRAYMRYARECSEKYAQEHPGESFAPCPLFTNGAACLRDVFPGERAHEVSAKISELIEHKDPRAVYPEKFSDLQVRIEPPIETLGRDLLNIFQSPKVHELMLSFFRGNYRIEWVSIYRTLPAERVASSWLWHSDSYPPRTIKLFLHLSPVTKELGATQFMNLEDTMAYRRSGYFGQYLDERYADLEAFAKEKGLPYRPFHFDANPGDATVFDMNFFHRAVSPKTSFRDVVQFYLLPNETPWDEQVKKDGIENLVHAKGSGYPKNPKRG